MAAESRKVAWSNRSQVVHNAAIYLCVIVAVTGVIALLDIGVTAAVRALGI